MSNDHVLKEEFRKYARLASIQFGVVSQDINNVKAFLDSTDIDQVGLDIPLNLLRAKLLDLEISLSNLDFINQKILREKSYE